MIEVIEVKTKKQIREFINFPLNLYKNNPYFVPPLYIDEKKLFNKNYIYNDQAEAVYYNAYLHGKIVGRISGILQHASNEKWNQKRVRFTRFDSIDNQDVANALFSKVENWAKEHQMEEIVGPLGFSDLDREGLLIEGFDELSTFEEQYNYPYYQKLIENYGFVKEVDWLERKLKAPKVIDERLERVSSYMMKKCKLKFVEVKSTRQFLKQYSDALFEIIDTTYDNLYQTVPFTDAMKKMMIDNFKLIINIKYVAAIVDENNRVVCFGICFPSIAKALQKSGGRLTIPAIFRLLKALKKPNIIDLGLIGVLPEYQMRGISTAIIAALQKMISDGNIEYAETNLNLETNNNIQNQWKNFDGEIHKRRRSSQKSNTLEKIKQIFRQSSQNYHFSVL